MIEVLTVLIIFAIVGAIVAVETPNLLFSVISVGAVGFLLSIAFVFLAAPDIAIVQVAVEVIGLVILLRATIGRDVRATTGHRQFVGMVAAVTLVVVIGLFGIRIFTDFPELGVPVMDRVVEAPSSTYLRDGLAATGAPNIVTAVLLDFRAYDTLGEATVLFCAVLGALTILRRKARVAEPAEDAESKLP